MQPADNCRVSEPPAPFKTSRLPCPEDAMVNVSSPLPPVRLLIPEPLIILYPPLLDKVKSIVPVSLAVNETVPELLELFVAIKLVIGSVVTSLPDITIKISPVSRSFIFTEPEITAKVSLPPFPIASVEKFVMVK